MPKIDLTTATRIKVAGGEVRALKGQGFVWTKPPVMFPAAAMAAGGDYFHFRVEDAGEVWNTAHGSPLMLSKIGTPGVKNIGGVDYLDCASGCYAVTRSPYPSTTPFSIWALAEHNSFSARMIYNGNTNYNNNPVCFAVRTANAAVYSGNTIRTYAATSGGVHSYCWSRTAAGHMSEIMSIFEDGVSIPSVNTGDRSTAFHGERLVIGGDQDTDGNTIPRGLVVRDVVVTVGWNPNEEQRAALEAYRQSRTAP